MLGGYATDVYRKMLIWIALALSYNFLFGIAGQVAFSHFAFAGVGAYAVVILATVQLLQSVTVVRMGIAILFAAALLQAAAIVLRRRCAS